MIKHDDAFFEMTAGFDWDFLNYAFYPTKIKPMDIDGIVERNGKILMFETRKDDKPLFIGTDREKKDGQSRMYRTLLDFRKGYYTLFYMVGKTPKTMRKLVMYYYIKGKLMVKEINPCNYIDIAYWVYRWFCKADNKKSIPQEKWVINYNEYKEGFKSGDQTIINIMKGK